jgi:mitofilin
MISDRHFLQAENFSSLLEEGKQKALGEQRESLAAEARERLSELESKLQEAEEAASMYAKLSETVSKSVEALKAEAEENARELANYFQTVAKDTVERERSDRIAVLRDMALKMELLEKHRDDNVEGSQKIAELQKLHGAVNALGIALHSGSFKKELDILAKLGENNAVVKSCVDMVADTAATGVLSDFELERRFVEGVRGAAIRAGRMPEGGGVGSYFLSAVAGVLPFVKKTEADFIIEQAEKLLKAGDVEGAAREVNQLKGWAKVAAKDWLEAARRKVKANYAHDVGVILVTFDRVLAF